MEIEIKELVEASEQYRQEVQEWLSTNQLTELPEFRELHDKDIWGEYYRLDQIHYETVADFKSKLFAIKSMALYMANEKYNGIDGRQDKKSAEKLIEAVDNEIWGINNEIDKAKQRLKFYESITYVIGNITYGSF